MVASVGLGSIPRGSGFTTSISICSNYKEIVQNTYSYGEKILHTKVKI